MKTSLLLLSLTISFLSFSQALQNIESVEYDHENSRFLVSNSNSIIAMDQPTLELSFFGDGAAGFGMEVMNNTLFAISNGIKGYDLSTEEEVMSLSIPGSGFLNGMASDGVNRLWVTDFSNGRIYEIDVTDLDNPTSEMVVANTGSTPNGIVYDETNDRLVFVNWGGSADIKAVNLQTYQVSTLTGTSLGNCDGIDNDAADNYFVSSWSPLRISKFNSDFSGTPETIEAPGISNPADICYAKEIDTLAIPNSGNNTVTFVGFENPLSVRDRSDDRFQFGTIGNPITNQSYFQFTTTTHTQVALSILDESGKTVVTLIEGMRSPGEYKVLLNGVELATGIYFAQLRIGNDSSTKKIIVP
ncbi:T9SS type A sorting domain-containing protein [Cryomorphaceae bacterium 1068]|nr:T9SS type A sorting domain-containing protein [Cryomorphaceae bacterium 1068]